MCKRRQHTLNSIFFTFGVEYAPMYICLPFSWSKVYKIAYRLGHSLVAAKPALSLQHRIVLSLQITSLALEVMRLIRIFILGLPIFWAAMSISWAQATAVKKPHLRSPNENRIMYEFIAQTSSSNGQIRNLSLWNLKSLGTNLAILQYLNTQALRYFNTNWVINKSKASLSSKELAKEYVGLSAHDAPTDEELRKQVEENVMFIRPQFKKMSELIKTLIARYRKFISVIQATYAIDATKVSSGNFLLDYFDAQLEHFGGIKNLENIDTTMSAAQVTSSLLDNKKTLTMPHLRASVHQHSTQVQEERVNKTSGERTYLFQRHLDGNNYEFLPPEKIDLCAIQWTPEYCTPASKPVPRAKRNVPLSPMYHLQNMVSDVKKGKHRTKRFIILAILAAISLLTCVATTAYLGSEVTTLHKELNAENDAMDDAVTNFEITQQNLDALNAKVDKHGDLISKVLAKLQINEIDERAQTCASDLELLLSEATAEMQRNEDGFTSLRTRSFPYQLSSHAELVNAYKTLVLHAVQSGQRLFLDQPSSLYRCTTDIVLFDSEPFILTHIPTRAEDIEPLRVLKLSEEPVIIKNLTFTFESTHRYVITNKEMSYFKELTTNEFENCLQVRHEGKVWAHCPFLNSIFSRDISRSCNMRLLTKDYTGIAAACKVLISHSRDYAIQRAKNTFHVYAAGGGPVEIKCTRRALNQHFNIQGHTEITVPDGCSAFTPSHVLFANFDTVMHQSIVHVTKPFDIEAFMSALHAPFDKTLLEIEKQFKALHDIGKPRQLDLTAMKDIVHKIREDENSYMSWLDSHKSELLFGCSFLVALSFAAFLFIRRVVRKRIIRREAQRVNEQQQPLNARPIIR